MTQLLNEARSRTASGDAKGAYEKYMRLHPDDIAELHGYTQSAYICEQWDTFNELISKLGKDVDFAAFGGKAKFDEMVGRAKAHATKLVNEK